MSQTNKITLLYSYYENPATLAYHATQWAALPRCVRDSIKIRVIDDGSPTNPAADVLSAVRPFTELYRIKVDIPWNSHGARNLGAYVTGEDEWLLMVDMDILVPPSVLCYLLQTRLDDRAYYTFRRAHADGRPLHPGYNILMTTARNFWSAGGYDEDFSGTYGGDEYFVGALRHVATVSPLDQTLIALNEFIPDSTTRTLGREGSKFREEYLRRVSDKRARGPKAFIPTNPLRFAWERVW